MKVITNRPVVHKDEEFYNIFGLGKNREQKTYANWAKNAKAADGKDSGGGGGDNALNTILGTAAPLLSGLFKKKDQAVAAPQIKYIQQPVAVAPTGMSKGLKTGLIIGGSVLGLIVIGGIIYVATKAKKAT